MDKPGTSLSLWTSFFAISISASLVSRGFSQFGINNNNADETENIFINKEILRFMSLPPFCYFNATLKM
jgi:hypothetical protein